MINKAQMSRQLTIGVLVVVGLVVVGVGVSVVAKILNMGSNLTGDDGMLLLYVPAGEFTMGTADGELHEQPVHVVNLDAFWIDQTEVTNKMYAVCVEAGACSEPVNKTSFTHVSYYGNDFFDNYPLIYVNWEMAKTYCVWAGRRLPTEAEWEKAARGVDERTYPWGEELIDGVFANFNSKKDTTIVGSFERGKSPYGAYDMAGNVWEWVNDWYSSTYYQVSPTSNPVGPDSGTARVLRGGSWNYDDYEIRSANRNSSAPTDAYYNIGFRCARSQ